MENGIRKGIYKPYLCDNSLRPLLLFLSLSFRFLSSPVCVLPSLFSHPLSLHTSFALPPRHSPDLLASLLPFGPALLYWVVVKRSFWIVFCFGFAGFFKEGGFCALRWGGVHGAALGLLPAGEEVERWVV